MSSQKVVVKELVATSMQACDHDVVLPFPEEAPSLKPQNLQQQGGGDVNRFHPEMDTDTLEFMSKKRFSANTDCKVNWAANLYWDWCKKRLENALCDPCIKAADLDRLRKLDKVNLSFALSNFINEIKRRNGQDFPATTLYQITVCLQFFVAGTRLEWKLIDDPVFIHFCNILDNMMKACSKAGVSRHVRVTLISLDQEELLWSSGVLGEDDPDTLRNTVMYLLGISFVLQGGEEQWNLCQPNFNSQISVKTDAQGDKNLLYQEDITSKTNQGGLSSRRNVPKVTKVYGSNDPLRNVVRLFEKYVNLIPPNIKHPSLYKYAVQERSRKPNVWFTDCPLGKNALSKIVKNMCEKAGLTGEKFTNHSLCASTVMHMFQSGVDEQIIKTVTGHKSDTMRDYKHVNDEILHQAQDTLHSKLETKLQKAPAMSTVSTPPGEGDDDCVEVAAIEPLQKTPEPDVSIIAKPGICQYMKVSGCEGMCQVLKSLDDKVAEHKLK